MLIELPLALLAPLLACCIALPWHYQRHGIPRERRLLETTSEAIDTALITALQRHFHHWVSMLALTCFVIVAAEVALVALDTRQSSTSAPGQPQKADHTLAVIRSALSGVFLGLVFRAQGSTQEFLKAQSRNSTERALITLFP